MYFVRKGGSGGNHYFGIQGVCHQSYYFRNKTKNLITRDENNTKICPLGIAKRF